MSKIATIAAATLAVLNCFADDDLAAVQAAMLADKEASAAKAGMRAKASSTRLLSAQSDNSSVTYTASGDLDNVVGSGNLNFRFVVDKPFTQITSAKLEINAYDVDYPSANEHDKVYFNGSYIGRLKGVNGAYEVNTFSISPSLIKCPTTDGATAANTFSVAVNVDNGGWVTGVGWAKLIISGETFKLTASRDDPNGIFLRWTDLGGQYEVWRRVEGTREIQWVRIKSDIHKCEYLDSSKKIEYGKPYYYKVRDTTRLEKVSNEAVGYIGKRSNTPMIDKVEVSRLWLTGTGPYNVRLTWNNFDKTRYKIEGISFDLSGTGLRYKWASAISETVPTVIDLSSGGQTVPAGIHGVHELKIEYDVFDTIDNTHKKNLSYNKPVEVRIYFEKYKSDGDGLPNWFVYWPKDGAISGKYFNKDHFSDAKRDRKFHYDGEGKIELDGRRGYLHGSHVPPDGSIWRKGLVTDIGFITDNVPPGCAPLYTLTGDSDGKFSVTDAGVSSGAVLKTIGRGEVGQAAVGLHKLACLIAHETKHEELFRKIANHRQPYVYVGKSRRKATHIVESTSLGGAANAISIAANAGSQYNDYFVLLKNSYLNGFLIMDSDGDGILDDYEQEIGLDPYDSDKHEIAASNRMQSEYSGYGDNEVLAREAENNPVAYNTNKDWAFPGANICPDCQGETKDEWGRHKNYEMAALQSFDRSRVLLQSFAPSALQEVADVYDDDSQPASQSGILQAMPEMVTNEEVTVQSIFSVSDGYIELDTNGLISAVYYDVEVTNRVGNGVSALIRGYISDANGLPVAWAKTYCDSSNSVCKSRLSFSSDVICARQPFGIHLKYLTVEDSGDGIGGLLDACITNIGVIAEYNALSFARGDGYLRDDGLNAAITNGMLEICVPVQIYRDGEFSINGVLETTNGVFVASSETKGCTNGQMEARLSFSGEDIYFSRQNGPYVLRTLQLIGPSGNVICGKSDALSIDGISYSEFHPSESVLDIDVTSFKEIKNTALPDGKRSGLFFDFACTNKYSDNLTYRVRTTLCGTDGVLVAACVQNVVLEPGSNVVAVTFAGSEIRSSGTDGPYTISEVKLDPIGEIGAVERFVPGHISVDYKSLDFAAAPFSVSDEVICRTDNVYKPIVVEVPIDVMRAGDITASAIVTDTNGEFVVRSETNLTVAVGNGQTVAIEFNARDLMSSGISGPYKVHYLVLRSGYEGVEEVRIEDFSAIVEYTPTLYVNAQRGNDDCDGLSDGTSLRTIQAALDFASDGTVINVGAGDYICPAEIEGETFLNIDKKVSIIASGSNPSETRIVGPRGSTANDVRGVWLAEGATLSGFTITNFLMSAGGGVGVYGDGLGAVVSNCVIAGCSATHDGGGVYQCSVYDSTIRNCRAQNGGGAAHSTLINCNVENNTATRYGGGVANCNITNCVVSGNVASQYGGGVAYGDVAQSRITGNRSNRYGGGVYNANLEDCQLRDNSAAQYGGGAFMSTLRRCLVIGNKSTGSYGGGIMDSDAYDCIIQRNESATFGGGAGYSRIYNCTIIGNHSVRNGGGVYNSTVANSIIWGNTTESANPIYDNHSATYGAYNCTTPCMAGDGNIDSDPLLRGVEFGGFMLSAESPCLEAGLDNNEEAEYYSNGLTNYVAGVVGASDFLRNERVQGAHVDMGAVEGVTNACLVMTRTIGHGSLDVSMELLEPHSTIKITADESIRPLDHFELSDGRVIMGSELLLSDITSDVFVTAHFKFYDFYVDAQGGDDSNDGFSWATAKKTIQAALDLARDGEKIYVAKGSYTPINSPDKGVEIFAVDGADNTFIDGGGTNRCAYLATTGTIASQTNTVLVGFTLMNGRAASGGGAYGGTLKNCIIKSNAAEGSSYCYGGGTYYGVQYDCRYEKNSASATMYGYGGAAYYGTSYNCSYVDNSVYGPSNACGGAVYYGTHYDCGLTNNTSGSYGGAAYGGTWYRASVSKNRANHGGGFYYGSVYESTISGNRSSGDGGGANRASLIDCVVVNNQAGGSGGGALLTEYIATRTVFKNNIARGSGGGVYGGTCNYCGITNNTASSNGGGAYNITASRTSFFGNSAATGGGVYNGTYNSCTIEGNTSSGEGGGAYSGTFYDSLIANNDSNGVGGGLSRGTFHRTKITGNRSNSDGGGVYNGTGYNSLIVKNKGLGNGGGTYSGYNYNCTITENWCGGNGGGTCNGYQYNNIIWSNTNPDGANNNSGASLYSCRTANPSFVNPGESDYRLRVGSPCINAGNNSYANGSTDMALETRIQGGTVDMGAYEGGVEGFVITIDSVGVGDLEYGSSLVTNGGSFAISASSTGRTFLHFKTNGVVATTAPTLTLDGITRDVKVTAEFVHEMFVDGANGADDNDGLSWSSAKKSIQAAIDESMDGDTIWVSDGVYAPVTTDDRRVDIVGVNGAKKTIIDGGGAECCAYLGTDYRFSNNSRLSGFTLRNGYGSYGGGAKYGKLDNCIVENCRATTNGGGVDYSNVSNCIIRNNSAQASGGGLTIGTWRRAVNCRIIGNVARENGGGAEGGATFRNCEFISNIAGSNGGAMYNGNAYDSTFTKNRAAFGGATYNGTFYRCSLASNTSTGEGGGAYSGTFYDSVISNNTASGVGGGLRGSTFHRSHVVCNKASGEGGGVYSGTGYNSIIAKNKANGNGGGTYSGYNYNCTITENYSALNGGGAQSGYLYNSIIWKNHSREGESNCNGVSLYNCHTADPRFVNAAENDYRLRSGSLCLNTGNNSYANGSLDVSGRTRIQDGTVDVGAHEGCVDGFVVDVILQGGATISHSSVVVGSNGTFTVYAVSSVRPFAGILTNGVFASSTVPFTLMGITSDVELTVDCVHDLYVNCEDGDDGNSGFSRDAAKQSIQAAINASLSGDIIHVADGCYAPFSSGNRDVLIKSDNGPDNCVVHGDYSARCATLGGSPSEVQTTIEGLTLCNGYSSAGGGCYYGTAVDCIIEDCYSTGDGGGAYGTLLHDCTLVGNVASSRGGGVFGDKVLTKYCTISDNISYGNGGGVYGGLHYHALLDGNRSYSNGGGACDVSELKRSIVRNNQAAAGGGSYNGSMWSCLYYDNYASSSAGGAYYGTLRNCTLTRNKAAGTTGGMYYSTAYNTICRNNKLNSGATHDSSGSSYYNCCLSSSSGSNTIVADPLFYDAANDDFRLSMDSPCLNSGNNSYATLATDILENPRIQDGTVDIGCYEGPVYVWQIDVVVCGHGTVINNGTSTLDGGDLSFTAVEEGYPFLGFYTNGVFATAEKEFTWRGISGHGTLEAWFKQDVYVDARMADDSGDGLTWETARKDLAAVVAETSNGANIWVKSGTYTPIATDNKKITITAVDGNSTTVIDGGRTDCCVYAYTNNVSISLMTNTVVVGFTLKNGYALQGGGAYGGTLRECVIESNTAVRYGGGTYYGVQQDCAYSNNSVEGTSVARGGAAYYGTSYNCTYEGNSVTSESTADGGAIFGGAHYDCTVTNNTSSNRGGGICNATCYRCVLTDNKAQLGGASYAGILRDCLIVGNGAANLGGGSYSTTLVGCTVVDNTSGDAGGVYLGTVRNSIIWGNSVTNGVSTNCVAATLMYTCTDSINDEIGCIAEDPKFVDAENGDYRLLLGSPCLDAGNNSYLSSLFLYDVAHKNRIMNNVVDMGCYEGAFSIAEETQSTPEPVPHSWLNDYPEIIAAFGGDYEAMASAPSPGASGGGKTWPDGSPYYVWQDFVAGTSPTNDTVFTATIRMEGNTPVITWEPDTPELRATRVYRTLGKKTLLDANWTDITDKDQSEYHFFRVTVDMP